MKTPYQVLLGHETEDLVPPTDWRELIVRMADAIVSDHYRDYQATWPRPETRRVLEAVVDTEERINQLQPGDLQQLVQVACYDEFHQGAVVGAALAMAWPQSVAGFDDWLNRARGLAGLDRQEGGITPLSLASDLHAHLGWGARKEAADGTT